MTIHEAAQQARKASIQLAATNGETKNQALKAIADALKSRQSEIIEANQMDLKRSEQEGLDTPLLKRLKFDEAKIEDCVKGIESLITMENPVEIGRAHV